MNMSIDEVRRVIAQERNRKGLYVHHNFLDGEATQLVQALSQVLEIIDENITLKERVKLLELANKNANCVIEEEVNLKTNLIEKVEELEEFNKTLDKSCWEQVSKNSIQEDRIVKLQAQVYKTKQAVISALNKRAT